MTTDVPSWIPSVEEMFSVCEDHVYELDAEAIRALVAERHRQHEESIVHAREQLDRERKKRGVVEDPCKLAEMALEVERKHPGIHMRAGWPELPVIAAALVAERAAQTAPERQEKAGEDLRECPTWYELRKAVESATTKWAREQFEGVDTSLADAEDAAVRELWNRRAPAQPARSTPNDELRAGLKEAWNLAGVLADVAEHNAKTCDQDDEEGFVDHEAALQHAGGAEMARAIQREIKLLSKKLPACEKDGEADEASVPYLDAELARRFFVEEIETYAKLYPNATTDEIQRAGMRAVFARLGRRAAPRSPSPLSAPISEVQQVVKQARRLRFAAQNCVNEYGTDTWHGTFALLPMAIAELVTALDSLDMIEKRAIIERERTAPAPSIAQQAEPSVAGVPTVDDVMDAYNAGTTRFDEDLTLAHSAMTALEFTAARQRAGFAAVRALCLASRGARGTEDDRSRKSNELVQRAKPLIEALWAGAPTKPADSRMWLEAWTEHMKGHLSTCGYVQFDGMRVAMTGECLCPGDATPEATDFDDMEGRGPCGGSRCFLSHARDGVWIHSSKSYRTCSVRRAAPSRGERREAPASVERDAALEEAARVCDEEVESANRSIASLPPREHELLEHAECSRLVAKLLAARVRAMKSTPAPSSASVTPKNDGGAK